MHFILNQYVLLAELKLILFQCALVRSDMLYAGLLDAFEKLKNEVAYAPTSSSSAKSIKKKMGSGEQKDGASEDGPSSEEEDYDSSDDGDDLMSDER